MRHRGDYRHIYFSPHLDDVVLSCAGRIARQTAAGSAVLIVTIFAGSRHRGLLPRAFAPFQDVAARRREDRRALAVLAAEHQWLEYPDAIQRHHRYTSLPRITAPLARREQPIRAQVAASVSEICQRWPAAVLYFPLGIGNHVDHQIVSATGFDRRPLDSRCRREVVFYEDTPYVCIPHLLRQRFEQVGVAAPHGRAPAPGACAREAHAALLNSPAIGPHVGPVARWLLLGLLLVRFARARSGARRRQRIAMRPELIDVTAHFETKIEAIARYGSQVAALYGNVDTMRRELAACSAGGPGTVHERYWRPTNAASVPPV